VSSWKRWAGIVQKPRGRGTSAVGSRYRTTATEDVTVDTSVSVLLLLSLLFFNSNLVVYA
jgi:hypothetical protein